ncbi:MAG TPA: TIGR04282 family arsenosugar biosynthesis glycosyltransferase [Acetobacteraceae bacterium]|nr:TIGR04282 family arsenosugar biosynthesis glycosyltransferase [Acetobacteraceae bacterium]
MRRAEQCAIAVMAKAPRPNHVKTRLVPPLTAHEAAALNASFLRDVTENIREAGRAVPIAGFVAYAPAGSEPLFGGMLAPGTGLVLADGSLALPSGIAGIGRALLHAAGSLLEQGYGAVCLVNSDSPTLPTAFLREAAEALARPGDRMVLGVAEDGGYYLVGLKAPHAALFQDIAWSTDQVSAQTLARAATLGLEVVTPPPWFDVDDPASLARLVEDLTTPRRDGPTPYAAPATRACVERIALAERVRGQQSSPSPCGSALGGGVGACRTNPSA